jgi:hypothetical protein
MTAQSINWYEFILAGGVLFVLLLVSVIGLVRPDIIHNASYTWARYWSYKINGNADKLDRKLSESASRPTTILRVYSGIGLALIGLYVVLMLFFR